MQTFTNLPDQIARATANILSRSDIKELSAHAQLLHDRYTKEEKEKGVSHVRNPSDILAYLSLRFPATYAQLMGAFLQIKERMPHWQPKTVLDLGCGPATGILAAKEVWSSIETVTGVDQEKYFLSLAEELVYESKYEMKATWVPRTITSWIDAPVEGTYDLIIVANVLNELSANIKEQLFKKLATVSSGIVVFVESGTPRGFAIIQSVGEKYVPKGAFIAPYIDTTFIKADNDFWIHFPQRFIRPEFQRRVRQSMRESALMASNWEEAKYSFVAFGNIPLEKSVFGQCVGTVERYHGYVTLPVLTASGIETIKVMKRHKAQYRRAKEIRWGELIEDASQLIFTP